MITSNTCTFFFDKGEVFISSMVAGRCGSCSRAAFLFIGRNGKTHCLHCEHTMVAPTDPDAANAFQKEIV
jgi:hypothetical protein